MVFNFSPSFFSSSSFEFLLGNLLSYISFSLYCSLHHFSIFKAFFNDSPNPYSLSNLFIISKIFLSSSFWISTISCPSYCFIFVLILFNARPSFFSSSFSAIELGSLLSYISFSSYCSLHHFSIFKAFFNEVFLVILLSTSSSNSTKSFNTPSTVNESNSFLLPLVLGIGSNSISHKSISLANSIISCILDLSSSVKSSKLSNPSKYLLYLLWMFLNSA